MGVPLASAGVVPAHEDFTGDIRGIRDSLLQLIEKEGKDVVLIAHSYTGMPAAQAPHGLSKKERESNGLRGAVIRLVLISAFAMPEGFQSTAGGAQIPEWMKVDTRVCAPTSYRFHLYRDRRLG